MAKPLRSKSTVARVASDDVAKTLLSVGCFDQEIAESWIGALGLSAGSGRGVRARIGLWRVQADGDRERNGPWCRELVAALTM